MEKYQSPTKRQLKDHINQLIRHHGLNVKWVVRGSAMHSSFAYVDDRLIEIKPVKSARTYAIALHEIGHIVCPQDSNDFKAEIIAWQWARQNAISWVATMEHTLRTAVDTYLDQHLAKGGKIPNGWYQFYLNFSNSE